MSNPVAIDINDMPWGDWPEGWPGNDGLVRWKRLVKGGGMFSGIMEFQPGGVWIAHHHAEAEIYYFTSGSGIIEVAGETFEARPGLAVFIPGNATHRTENTGTEPLCLFYVFPTEVIEDIQYIFD